MNKSQPAECSSYISKESAEQEFRAKKPAVGPTRIVKFSSGRLERPWVKNVVAIGNAFGFVEPLEATSLAMICMCCRNVAELSADGDRTITDTRRTFYNRLHTASFDRDRWFLSLLIGQQVQHQNRFVASASEIKTWSDIRRQIAAQADRAVSVEEALPKLKSPQWKWDRESFALKSTMLKN